MFCHRALHSAAVALIALAIVVSLSSLKRCGGGVATGSGCFNDKVSAGARTT